MASIEWINDTVREFNDSKLRHLVNKKLAVHIARQEDLGINEPAIRIESFISGLDHLFRWFGTAYRDFPWRRTRDPWKILVAEILLQRTRATKAAEVYRTFHHRFADAPAVKRASREAIFETVEPLGFGNRKTETLMSLAEAIQQEYAGSVPVDLETLQSLPRIGPYTARACLCFAFGEPLAIVDTNVATVVEDTLGYDSSRRAHKDEALYALLDALIPERSDPARVFNLALLDMPSLVCSKDNEERHCPFGSACIEDRT